MAEEETTGQGEGGGSATATLEDAGVEIPEAFQSWFGVQKKPAAAPEKAATPKEAAPVKPGTTPNQAQPPKDPNTKPGAEQKPEEKPNLLMQAFTGEDGNFDLDGFAKFAAPAMNQPAPPINLTQQNQQQQPKDEKPVWQQRLEEEKSYTENIRANTVGWAGAVRQLIAQGATPEQAIAHVEQQIAQNIDNHLNEWKAEREFKFKKEETEAAAKARQEAEESAAVPVRARTNIAQITAALPGKTPEAKTQLFNEILFSKEIGSPILDYEFARQHPGVDKMPPDQQKALAEKFINGITSDYKALSYFFDRALDKAARMNLPKLNSKVAAATEAALNANRLASQKRPGGTLGRQAPKEQPGADPWQAYFDNPEKGADRIN